ncbi:MAG: disulfide bond formation protein B, partial [Amylibacter sp.]
MTRKNLILIATLGSIATLCSAFGFQYIGNMAPCKLC